MFYLSGLVYGSYPKVEVHNLGRFISVTKFRPLTWHVSHPYILADRYVLHKRPVLCTVLLVNHYSEDVCHNISLKMTAYNNSIILLFEKESHVVVLVIIVIIVVVMIHLSQDLPEYVCM